MIAQRAALEDSLARDSTNRRAPIWLWTLGRLMRSGFDNVQGFWQDSMRVAPRRAQYWFSEPAAEFVYNGYHFRELVRRFPRDTLASDAGYELTKLGIVGECEGYVPCYIGREYIPLDEFLRAFPKSRLAAQAVKRANAVFTDFLKPTKHDAADTTAEALQLIDSVHTRELIVQYDSTASTLPPALRATAYGALVPIWDRWGNRARAAEMRQ